MKSIIFLLSALFTLIFTHCEDSPTLVDGEGELKMNIVWDTSSVPGVTSYCPLANSEVQLTSQYGTFIYNTDQNGVLDVKNLPSAMYNITVQVQHPLYQNLFIIGSKSSVWIISGKIVQDSIYAQAFSSNGIKINEIYCGGPVNNSFYFYDLYIELYNSSDTIEYLDGAVVMRISGNNDGKGPGADEDDDGDIDGVTYIFQFPGQPGEKNYPFQPKEFLVCATQAVDHTQFISTSIDLSHADWEFFNPFAAAEYDNPNVPNINNIRADRTTDFFISLTSDVIVLANGKDIEWADGIDIETIIDGVEYQSSSTSRITLDDKVDRGFILSPPKYGGKSMRRRVPGLDSDNGTMDWEIIDHPTPGEH